MITTGRYCWVGRVDQLDRDSKFTLEQVQRLQSAPPGRIS